MKFYSPNTKGFYDETIHGGNIPDDAVEITDAEHQALIGAQAQGKVITWDAKAKKPIASDPPAPPIEQVKSRQWEAIKAKREAVKAGGVKVGAKWYHTDVESRVQHLGLKDKARDKLDAGGAMTDRLQVAGQDIRWKTLDGSLIYITAQIAFDIITAVGMLDALAHQNAELHKATMEASADPATYNFSGGWPAVFEG